MVVKLAIWSKKRMDRERLFNTIVLEAVSKGFA